MSRHAIERRRPDSTRNRHRAGRAIGIVGAGQVGGSLIRRLGMLRPAVTVLATDRNPSLAAKIRRHARWRPSIESLVVESDLVVLAVPPQTILRLLPAVARSAARRARRGRLLVVDTGTIKGPVVAAAARWAGVFDFVGLHPTVGVERNGWEAGRADMFEGQTVIYCPAAPRPTAIARGFIRLIGARAVAMEPGLHDRRVAEGIGLPHIVAFAAEGAVSRVPPHRLRAGSWRSLTRVSVSDASMVAGFLAGNSPAQIPVLRRFQERVADIERLLKSGSVARLTRLLRTWQAGGRIAR